MHYNYFRDYDAEIGRYLESDPIGLNGGMSTFGYVGGNPLRFVDPNGLEIVGSWVIKGYPQIYDFNVVWGDARRPEGWWRFWENGLTYRAMEQRVDVRAGYYWKIKCTETCDSESWDIDGGTVGNFRVYVPIFTPIHPRLSRYTSILNPAYNLLIKPAFSDTMIRVTQAANLFYGNMTATQICKNRSK